VRNHEQELVERETKKEGRKSTRENILEMWKGLKVA
jgi:hypothetical protein